MKNLIRYSIYSLIAGVIISTLGMSGSISVKADTIKNSMPALFQGSMAAVIIGAILILLSLIFFAMAVFKQEK